MLRTPNLPLVGDEQPAGQERPHRQRGEDESGHQHRGPEPEPGRRGDLDELHDDGDDQVHRHAHEEAGEVGHEHRAVGQVVEVDQWVGGAQFVGGPHGQQSGTGHDDAEGPDRRPTPAAALAQDHRDPGDGQAQQHGARDVEGDPGGRSPPGQDHERTAQGAGHDDGAEPVGGMDVEQLGHHRGQRVAETGPDGGGHRQRGDGPRRPGRGQVSPGDGHVDGQEPEADALEAASEHEYDERGRHGGQHAPAPAPRPGSWRSRRADGRRRPGAP